MDIFELYCQEMLVTDFVGRRAYLINKMRVSIYSNHAFWGDDKVGQSGYGDRTSCHDVSTRLSLTLSLRSRKTNQYMIRRLIGFQYPYGRLYNRTCIANIVSRVCARHPYEIPDEIELWDERLVDCLVDLTSFKWQSILDQFQGLRDSMLRNDAALVVLPSELDDDDTIDEGLRAGEELLPEQDDSANETLESHTDFYVNYDEMLNRVKFHMCLSHLQPMLHTAIRKSSIAGGSESVVIPHGNIVAFE